MSSSVSLADDGDRREPRAEMIERILTASDPARVAYLCAIDGKLTLEDLWWLSEEHQIIVETAAWLWLMIRAGQISRDELERIRSADPWRHPDNR